MTERPASLKILQLPSGFTLLGEPQSDRESAAFGFAIPAGSCRENDHENGLATLVCEMLMRGAANQSSREFHNALDGLGVERGESVSASHLSLGGATLGDHLEPALRLYAGAIRQPLFPEEEFEAAKLVVLQEIQAAEDDPSGLVLQDLGKRLYPDSWGRPCHGSFQEVENLRASDVANFHRQFFKPRGAILAVAGKFDWDRLAELVQDCFGDWNGQAEDVASPQAVFGTKEARAFEAQQHHLAIAFDAAPFGAPKHLAAWAAVGILGGGGNSRLFSELREKRGLCYSVNATVHSFKGSGAVICQVSTSADRFGDSLAVTLEEIDRWSQGIGDGELQRLKSRIKSGLILQQESSSSRASSMARDWYHLGRVRSMSEIGEAVDQLSADEVNDYLREHPPRVISAAALGPSEFPG